MNLRTKLKTTAEALRQTPETSWLEIFQAGEALLQERVEQKADGLFANPPKILLATLDDAIGMGLKMIGLYSEIAGMTVLTTGLKQSRERIISECRAHCPDILGLTVLQFATIKTVAGIVDAIDDSVQVIAGGPVFNSLSAEELEAKPFRVINSIDRYIDFMLGFQEP